MSVPSRNLTPFKRFMKKIGITRYDTWDRPFSAYMRLDHVKDASKASRKLIDFKQETIEGWKMLSDQEIKGLSTGSFYIDNGVGVMEGNLVTQLTQEQKSLNYQHTGFVAIKSTEFYPPISVPDMDAVKLRIKTDKKLYLCQIKPLTPWEDDLYQGIIPIPHENEVNQWRNVVIPFNSFHLTYRGYLEEPRVPFDGRNIKHFGFMMAERQDGPFKIEIDSVSVCKESRSSKRYTGLDTHRDMETL